MKCKVINGLSAKTPEKLLLDAGAFFKNFKVGTDTYESAKATKLLGATKGGGSFTAVPTFRKVEVDGVRGEVKGLKSIEEWNIKIGASVVEASLDVLKAALVAVEQTVDSADSASKYDLLKGKTCIEDSDYLENITWVGNLSGSAEPVIIQVYNALNAKGLELKVEDKSEAVIELEFLGHFDMKKSEEVPFAIYYPKVTG